MAQKFYGLYQKKNDSKEKINLQTQRRVDIVMALDNASFVEAGEAAKDNDLYGRYSMELEIQRRQFIIWMQDGHNVWLLRMSLTQAMKALQSLLKNDIIFFYKMKDRQITYTVLTRENLFSEENRNLLFTISR